MLRVLGRRGLEAGISLFAVLGFCYVPLGAHTGLEHAQAIFDTPAAKRAGTELLVAIARIRSQISGEAQSLLTGGAVPTLPPLATSPSKDAAHSEHVRRRQ